MDSLEISLFEESDACYTYDHDSPIKHHPNSKKTKRNMFNNGIGKVMTSVYFDHTILELNKNCVFADHEKYALFDNYIVEFVHDADGGIDVEVEVFPTRVTRGFNIELSGNQ